MKTKFVFESLKDTFKPLNINRINDWRKNILKAINDLEELGFNVNIGVNNYIINTIIDLNIYEFDDHKILSDYKIYYIHYYKKINEKMNGWYIHKIKNNRSILNAQNWKLTFDTIIKLIQDS